jgi:hypothetical protein
MGGLYTRSKVQGKRPRKPMDKAHTVARLEEGPYVFPVMAPRQPYGKRMPQPQLPSLFGGNIENQGEGQLETTLKDEIDQESRKQYMLLPDSSSPRDSVTNAERGYTQHLYTSVVKSSEPRALNDPDLQRGDYNETIDDLFMPTLEELNTPDPLTEENFAEVFTNLFLKFAKDKVVKVPAKNEVLQKMDWDTFKFAKRQLVADSRIFRGILGRRLSESDFSYLRNSYGQSVVSEAMKSMRSHQRTAASSSLLQPGKRPHANESPINVDPKRKRL